MKQTVFKGTNEKIENRSVCIVERGYISIRDSENTIYNILEKLRAFYGSGYGEIIDECRILQQV